MTVRLRWGAVTDTGRVREANEDSTSFTFNPTWSYMAASVDGERRG